ncbi:MAG: hypothetical protein NDF52_00620 [archaeon YNP-WB-062]|jgi:hypothetical protein|nr:hypothetical protein [Candidatus Culexarchaeum yellowstonense]
MTVLKNNKWEERRKAGDMGLRVSEVVLRPELIVRRSVGENLAKEVRVEEKVRVDNV